MTTPVPLAQFTAQQYVEEAETPDVSQPGNPVDVQPLPIVATFTPSVSEIQVGTSVPFTVHLDPVQGRVDTDGYLKGMNDEPAFYQDNSTQPPTIHADPAGCTPVYTTSHSPDHWVDANGATVPNPPGVPVWGVRLVCSASIFSLPNPLTYRVDYTQGRVILRSFRFTAAATDQVLDLSTVPRLPL